MFEFVSSFLKLFVAMVHLCACLRCCVALGIVWHWVLHGTGYCIAQGISGHRYELEDLHVVDVLPQMVALSETYLQVYQQQDMPPLDLTKLRR